MFTFDHVCRSGSMWSDIYQISYPDSKQYHKIEYSVNCDDSHNISHLLIGDSINRVNMN
jgi:hypothetical protein